MSSGFLLNVVLVLYFFTGGVSPGTIPATFPPPTLFAGASSLTKSINDLAESFSSLTKEGDALLEFLGKLTSATVDSGTGFIKFARDVANALKFTIKQEIDDVNRAFDLLLGRTKNAKVGIAGTFTSPTEITWISTGLPKKQEEPKPKKKE